MTKSIDKYPFILPGEYDALWSAYTIVIKFHNGNRSDGIKMDNGIRGVNFQSKVVVDDDGWVTVID